MYHLGILIYSSMHLIITHFHRYGVPVNFFFLLDKFDYLAGLNNKWLYKGITTELVT